MLLGKAAVGGAGAAARGAGAAARGLGMTADKGWSVDGADRASVSSAAVTDRQLMSWQSLKVGIEDPKVLKLSGQGGTLPGGAAETEQGEGGNWSQHATAELMENKSNSRAGMAIDLSFCSCKCTGERGRK